MNTELRAADGGMVQVSPEILQSFKAGFRGPVLGPDAPDYDEVRKIWNAMIDRRPGLIVRCTGTADVQHAVRFARQHQFLLSVRGGGHNIAGLALAEGGLLIDLSLMRGVSVDVKGKTARAQGGCTLGDVDRETQVHGLAAVLGFVSATGIGGLTVGGGFGYLTRRFGYTCDNLVSMEVVTADGKVQRAAADENPDLFWALRGGGGNFGIVTSFEYKLYPVGPEILGGAVVWRAEDAGQVLDFYRSVHRHDAARDHLRGGDAHRAARALAAGRHPRQADHRRLRLPQRRHRRRARRSWRRCALSASRWPTSSRAGPTRRCRACSTPPSRRGGATTGSRTTWPKSTRRPSRWPSSTPRASRRRTRRSSSSSCKARSANCPRTTARPATATPPSCSTSPARGRRRPTTR